MDLLFPYLKKQPNHKAILAFHFAGGTAQCYKPFQELTKATVYAVQLPGREKRGKEPFLVSCQKAAAAVYDALVVQTNEWESQDWDIITHSVGSWIGYEFVGLLQKNQKKLPNIMIISCFPSPLIDMEKRPWRKSSEITEEEFQAKKKQILGL